MFGDVKRIALLATKFENVTANMDAGQREGLRQERTRLMFAMFVSVAVLGVSSYLLVSQAYDQATKQFASGFIGTVLGYWLKDSK